MRNKSSVHKCFTLRTVRHKPNLSESGAERGRATAGRGAPGRTRWRKTLSFVNLFNSSQLFGFIFVQNISFFLVYRFSFFYSYRRHRCNWCSMLATQLFFLSALLVVVVVRSSKLLRRTSRDRCLFHARFDSTFASPQALFCRADYGNFWCRDIWLSAVKFLCGKGRGKRGKI